MIAKQITGDASAIVALELIRPASDVVAPLGCLVGAVGTIGVAVAQPALMYARYVIVAVEFSGSTVIRAVMELITGTSNFVRMIGAIVVAVASPLGGDAVALRAGEIGLGATSHGFAVLLVTPVAAVVVLVTDPALLDAAFICASELVGPTSVVWKIED